MPDPTPTLSMASLEAYMTQNYPLTNPRWSGLWNVSQDNTLAADFLIQTPANVWGVSKDNFKVQIAGNYPDFGLQEGTEVTDFTSPGTKLCRVVQSTVTRVGGTPAKLYVSPGYGVYERIYDLMINAKYLVDITTLFRPSGQFKAAIKNAITYISSKPASERPKIRILHSTMGIPSTTAVGGDRHDVLEWITDGNVLGKVDTLLTDLTAGVPAGTDLEIYLAIVAHNITGWNHSKIVAADGCVAIAGGQNLWEDHYLGPEPVFDLSMELTGTAARHAHGYADLLWLWTPWGKASPTPGSSTQVPRRVLLREENMVSFKNGTIKTGDFPPDDFYQTIASNFPSPATSGATKVMAIGRQAQMRWPELCVPSATGFLHALVYRFSPDPEPADDAILQMFAMARTSIHLSLQNIEGGMLYYLSLRRPYMEAIARAVLRGVKVKMVVSSLDGGDYQGDDIVRVNLWLRDLVAYENGATWPMPLSDAQKTAAAAYVTNNFQCANIRFSADATYPDGESPRNHAKTFIVDEQMFFIGSHNLYPSNLNEFGFIVDDANAAAAYLRDYWNPLWTYSSVTYSSAFSKDGLDDVNKADAACFLADLPHNKRLNESYGNLLSFRKQFAPASGAPASAAYDNTTAVLLTNLLHEAGYETTAAWVRSALSRPPFAANPSAALTSSTPDQAAEKCVADLTTQASLLQSFDAVVFADYADVVAANAALDAWLTAHGYACSAYDLSRALNNAADQNLQLWTAVYSGGFEIRDGGAYFTQCPAFDMGAPNSPLYQPDWTPAYPAPAEAAPLMISTNVTDPNSPIPYVAYGQIEIQSPSFSNGVLTWTKGSGPFGNQTGGSLTFSRIIRPGMLDSFQGREVYGWIDKEDGTRVSYYSRESANTPPNPPPSKPRDTTANSNYTAIIAGVIGGAAGVGVIALCVGKLISRRAQDREGSRMKKDDDYGRRSESGEKFDGTSELPTARSSRELVIEMQETERLISPDQAENLKRQNTQQEEAYEEAQQKQAEERQQDTEDEVDDAEPW